MPSFLPKKMKTLRWYAPEEIKLDEIPLPLPQKGQVLVKIGAATTCGTDFKTFKRGHPRLIKEIPAPFGHEMAGTVVALGEGVTSFKEGDRVVVGNSAPCGGCFYCEKGQVSLCESLMFLNGAYAEYLLVPQRIVEVNLHRIPESLDFSTAALSEPLACVMNAMGKVSPLKGESMILIGAGPMGVLFVQLAKLQGLRLIALGRNPQKLENLKALGADHVVSLTEDKNPLQKVRDYLSEGRGGDIVLEAVGLPGTWQMAVDLVRPGGRVCFYGGCTKGTQISLDTYRLHYEELNLFGVFHHTPEYFKKAVEFLATEKIRPQGLVVGEYPLKDYEKVFRKGSPSNPLKYAIVP